MLNVRNLSASQWTRFVLAAFGLTLFALGICAFLAGILDAGGDSVGHQTFSAFAVVLASFVLFECMALNVIIAVRVELGSTEN